MSVILVMSLAGVASAQYVQPSQPPPMMPGPPPVPGPPETTVSRGIVDDAASSGMWLAPTALMAPAGTWTFEDNELFVMGGSYAIADNVAISAHTLVPISSDYYPLVLSGKVGLVDQGNFRLAATSNLMTILGAQATNAGILGLGGVGSLCLDTDCHSILNGFVGGYFLLSDQGEQNSIPLAFSLGIAQKLSRQVKLLAEIDGGAIVGDYDAVGDGFLAWYGLRFHSSSLAFNVGFAKPIISGDEDSGDVLPLGLPWVSLTFRSLPGQ